MLEQRPDLSANLSKGCQAYNVNMKPEACVHTRRDSRIARQDRASCIGLASRLDAWLAAEREMISRLHKYYSPAIDGRKCTNRVFRGGV